MAGKNLGKVQGINVVNQYHSKETDAFSNMILTTLKGPIKHSYYELVNKKGKVIHILETQSKSVAQSASYRLGLDYRLVEFEETHEDLDKPKDKESKEE